MQSKMQLESSVLWKLKWYFNIWNWVFLKLTSKVVYGRTNIQVHLSFRSIERQSIHNSRFHMNYRMHFYINRVQNEWTNQNLVLPCMVEGDFLISLSSSFPLMNHPIVHLNTFIQNGVRTFPVHHLKVFQPLQDYIWHIPPESFQWYQLLVNQYWKTLEEFSKVVPKTIPRNTITYRL